MDRPLWQLLLVQLAVAALLSAAVAVLAVVPQRRELNDLRHAVVRCDAEIGRARTALAAMPTRDRLEKNLARLGRRKDACAALRQNPAAMLRIAGSAARGTLSWRRSAEGAEGATAQWVVVLHTDYTGLLLWLRGLDRLNGCVALADLSVKALADRLEATLWLADPADIYPDGPVWSEAAFNIAVSRPWPGSGQRDPFRPASEDKNTPGAISGFIGDGERWLYWSRDAAGRWRRSDPPTSAEAGRDAGR